jgi:hypothetical protein
VFLDGRVFLFENVSSCLNLYIEDEGQVGPVFLSDRLFGNRGYLLKKWVLFWGKNGQISPDKYQCQTEAAKTYCFGVFLTRFRSDSASAFRP